MQIYEKVYRSFTEKIIFPLTKNDPEVAHDLCLLALQILGKGRSFGTTGWIRKFTNVDDLRLKQELLGIVFDNPVGIAAGFDKYCRGAMEGIYALGFGFGNYGSITAEKQVGNEKPRIERHIEEEALINWKGLDNDGAKKTSTRLHQQTICRMPVGVSIAKSTQVSNKKIPEDFLFTFKRMRVHADYVKLNISCPNTPGYRDLQQKDLFERVLGVIQEENYRHGRVVPILPKVSPDCTWSESLWEELSITIETAKKMGAVGIAGPNTTNGRGGLNQPYSLRGGMSGRMRFDDSLKIMRFVRNEWPEAVLIMSGGIFTPENAFEALKTVDLIEVLTSFVYRGPLIAYLINTGLVKLMKKNRVSHISQLRKFVG